MACVPSIFLFTGENAYAVSEERRRWIREFAQKHGEDSLIRVSGRDTTARELLDEISVAPFLSASRLVVVDGIPRCSKEEIDALERAVHPQTVLLFVDPSPDKRLAGTKRLLDVAQVKTFAELKSPQLRQWADALLAAEGRSIAPDAWASLLELTGTDQFLLSQELRKLSLRRPAGPVTRDDVEELSVPTDEGVVWKMTDLLCAGSRTEALRYARRIVARGGDAYGLWAILLSMLRNVVSVGAAAASGMTDQKEIAAETGVHPFALRSLLPYARKADPQRLRAFVARCAEGDVALKTGTLRSTDEAPEEILALIDGFILGAP